MTTALLLIDFQNDYLPGGRLPLWRSEDLLEVAERIIAAARRRGLPIVHIQHLAATGAPFLAAGTTGADTHPRILAAAPDAPIVTKHHADAFHQTRLKEELERVAARRLLLAGMMTQNCITHTALSRAADGYELGVLADCTTTVDETIHRIALSALSVRTVVAPFADMG